MILVVGLGNPGPRYAETRHNFGFMVVDRLVAEAGVAWRTGVSGRIASLTIAGQRVLALEPEGYMNESGLSVRRVTDFYKLTPAELLILHDELDLPFGELRLKPGGGDAGHRGVRSLISSLSTAEFGRLRLGIGRPPADSGLEPSDYVLEAFAPTERSDLAEVIERGRGAVTLVVELGFERAMNVVNQRTKNP